MGIFKMIRAARAKTKAEIKAAQAKARQAAKEQAKTDRRTAELLDKAERRLLQEEKKGLKRKRKHEKQLAKAHLKRVEQAGLTKKKAQNWVGAARIAVPVLVPLAYKALTSYQQRRIEGRAQNLGLSTQDLARYSGRGAELQARIDAIRNNTSHNDALGSGFTKDLRVRLDELSSAVANAEKMNPEQQRLAHGSIEKELKDITAEIAEKVAAGSE
ncbi:hypothetical protein CAPI_08980 [Corynebacterium capitovis DSM 44611]|uniref:DUF6474 family protein n=1 Tax=Corynebacterium capitovis TaxID=131081 RepID=UPI00035ED15C|nr:DUF6474 family protein [Corynebacterium capitovis]WKD58322.1 hypothetical protein CAPI_08980 [Corynebacterium capitovis DSM 44611]